MITFQHLSIRHFRSWKELELPLDNQGVVCIEGDTGAGKSSIFAALFWCLYGRTPEDIKADEVRPSRQPTQVQVTLEKDGHPYTVTRFRGSKEYKNKVFFTGLGIPEVVEDSHVRSVQTLIETFLGIPAQTFLATTHFAQRNFHYFHALTDQAKKAFIEGLTYGSMFEACEAETRQRLRSGERALDRLSGEISGVEASIKAMQAHSEESRRQTQDDITRLQGKAEGIQEHLRRLKAQQARLEKDVAFFDKLEDEIEDQTDKQNRLKDDIERYKTNRDPCPRCGLIMPDNLANERMFEAQKKVNDLEDKIITLSKKRAQLFATSEQYRTSRQWIDEKEVELKDLQRDIAVHKKELARAGDTGELEAKIDALMSEHQSLSQKLLYTAFWVKGFGFQGLRSFVLSAAIAYLAGQVERYLPTRWSNPQGSLAGGPPQS